MVACGGVEQRQKLACEMEDGCNVDAENLGPGVVGKLLQRRTPGNAGIVDQDVQPVRAHLHLSDQGGDARFAGYVAGKALGPAVAALRVELGGNPDTILALA